MLADAYERLRHHALEVSTRGGGLQGLAILIRKGMAAWMQAHAAAATPAVSHSANNGMRIPPGVQPEVIDVLAAMALGRMEVRA
jgi:hypothetical protein